jgi:preprotein translocase subunit YajC
MDFILLMTGAPEGQGGGGGSLIFIGLMFVVLYFFMIRPQAKKAKDQKEFISSIEKGMKVVTSGGIHGKVAKVEENTLLIEVDGSTKLRIDRNMVSVDMTKANEDQS